MTAMNVGTFEEVGNFEAFVKSHINKESISDTKEIKKKLRRMRKLDIPNFDKVQAQQIMLERVSHQKDLATNFLLTSIQKHFPLISDELLSKKRFFVLKAESTTSGSIKISLIEDSLHESIANEMANKNIDSCKVEVKLIISCPLGSIKDQKIGDCIYTQGRDSYNGRLIQSNIAIHAKIPKKPEAAILSLKANALQIFYKTIAEMVGNKDMTSSTQENGNAFSPEFYMAWIPSPKSLSFETTIIPADRDPALLMKICDKYFLLGTWDVEEELPIDSYLREFSSGSMKNVVRIAKS